MSIVEKTKMGHLRAQLLFLSSLKLCMMNIVRNLKLVCGRHSVLTFYMFPKLINITGIVSIALTFDNIFIIRSELKTTA